MAHSLEQSRQWFDRAARVIPGGIYGHTTPATTVPGAFPYFAEEGHGCRFRDVDGNEYIDFLCGYGPMVLGYHHPIVEEAAARQREKGNCFNHPTPLMVELAEWMTERVSFADWAVFGKNGSDMTTWCLQVAREFTGRPKILQIKGAYHGTHAWCTPGHGGLIAEDRTHIHTFGWNDAEAFETLIHKHAGKIAAVILTPFHHPAFGDSVLPEEEFFKAITRHCQREGILVILDDIRAGFRLSMGGSHEVFPGLEPDLICFCKAMGNGYPISAALGRRELKVAASKVFLTGSYWNSAVPMAAALACMQTLEKENGIAHMEAMGRRLCDGLLKAAEKHGLRVTISGPPAVPFMSFSDESNFILSQKFAAACIREGVFFHPHHNWFLSTTHQESDIDQALAAAERAFQALSTLPT